MNGIRTYQSLRTLVTRNEYRKAFMGFCNWCLRTGTDDLTSSAFAPGFAATPDKPVQTLSFPATSTVGTHSGGES